MGAARPTLLVLRPLGLGDFLTGVPAYRALARAFATYRRVLAAPPALHELLPLLGGAFDDALATEPLVPLPQSAAEPAIAVDLHGRGPASHRVLLATRPGRLFAFANPEIPESAFGPAWDPDEHEVARWCRLLEHFGVRTDASDLALAVPHEAAPAHLRGATIVHAGAASAARRWPAERWVDVISACGDARRVVLTGSAQERPVALEIARRANVPLANVVAGQTSLYELAAIVAAAKRVLCADTGMAHLATAYGIASVVLFGPTPPRTWGPPSLARHRVLWAGGTGDPHATSPDPGLLAIGAADVIAELEHLTVF
jgi:ADP-heptose:LPS heptosyltransferase